MTVSPVSVVFWGAFFVLFTLCGFLHLHLLRTVMASGIGAGLCVLILRPWWKKGLAPPKRPSASFKDPRLGTRAERRAQKKRRNV